MTECAACKTDPNHAPFQYGPFPWVWCHEMNAGHSPDIDCHFQIGCNICQNTWEYRGVQEEEWENFLRKHTHKELRLKKIPKKMRLGISPKTIKTLQDHYS